MLPTKNQLLNNFSSCMNWEEKYMYIIDLGRLLPKFPDILRVNKNLITGCQSYTWLAIVNNENNFIKFYGDSDAAIVKGIIVIIFSLYQNLNIQSILQVNAKIFLDQIKLTQNLTITRSHGVYSIINAIRKQTSNLLLDNDSFKDISITNT